MNLLRATGRAMLATFFIANGVKALRDPDALVPASEPFAARFVPFAQKALPEALSAYVPEDTRSLVRLGGLAAIAGGLCMATGIAPRAGGALAAASMLPHLVAADPRGAADRKAALGEFATKLALTGAALVVTQDTRGRPSVLWRANDSAARLGRSTGRAVEGVQADAQRLGRRAQKRVERAARAAQKRLDTVAKDAKGVLQ
jgi:putative oxidoreductase